MASGEAEAILVRAQATAKGIAAVAQTLQEGQEAARGAVSLTVADKYVEAFGNLAKEGTAVIVPGNMGDMGGMIASAMGMYGKIAEGQARSMSAGLGRATRTSSKDSGDGEEEMDAMMGKTDDVAKSVLQGFEQTRNKR